MVGWRRQWWKRPRELLSTESLIFVFQLSDVCSCHVGLFGLNVPGEFFVFDHGLGKGVGEGAGATEKSRGMGLSRA